MKLWKNKNCHLLGLIHLPLCSHVVLHREGEPRQRGHMCGSFTLARAWLQPPHHLGHVVIPSIQWQPVSQRRADTDAQQLHAGRLHHLCPGHGGQNHLIWQERRGVRWSAWTYLHHHRLLQTQSLFSVSKCSLLLNRSQSWPLRMSTPPSCIRVWCSTAATQERRSDKEKHNFISIQTTTKSTKYGPLVCY